MQNRNKELLKNTTLLMIGNIGSKLLSFVLIPIYTSLLTTSEYGIFDLLATTESLLIPILTIDIGDGIFRYVMDKNSNCNKVFSSGMAIWGAGCILAFFITFIFQCIFSSEYCWFVFITFICHSLYTILINYAKGIDRLKIIAIGGIINTFSFGTTCILLLVILKQGLNGYMISYVIGFIVPDILIILSLMDRIKIRFEYFDFMLAKEMIKYSFPLVFASISWWIISASDRYMVTYFCGNASNGIYSMAYKIPNILAAVMTIFSQAWVISAVKVSDKSYYKNTYRFYTTTLSMVALIFIGLSEFFGRILYSEDFYVAWKISPILIVAAIYQGLTGFLCDLLTSKKDAFCIALSSVIGSIFNILLNFFFIQRYNALGAAISTLISYCIVWFFLCCVLSKKHYILLLSKIDIVQIILVIVTATCITHSLLLGYITATLSVFIIAIINYDLVKQIFLYVIKKILKR